MGSPESSIDNLQIVGSPMLLPKRTPYNYKHTPDPITERQLCPKAPNDVHINGFNTHISRDISTIYSNAPLFHCTSVINVNFDAIVFNLSITSFKNNTKGDIDVFNLFLFCFI